CENSPRVLTLRIRANKNRDQVDVGLAGFLCLRDFARAGLRTATGLTLTVKLGGLNARAPRTMTRRWDAPSNCGPCSPNSPAFPKRRSRQSRTRAMSTPEGGRWQ